jgi:hypothetical protein
MLGKVIGNSVVVNPEHPSDLPIREFLGIKG